MTSMAIESLVKELEDCLPELEWKLNHSAAIPTELLPRDLFSSRARLHPEEIITILKQEIERLSQQTNHSSCHYLAERIHRKISLIVSYLQLKEEKSLSQDLIQSISTRQQFVQKLEKKIQALRAQQDALNSRLLKSTHPDVALELKKEIGKIEQYITEIKEQNHLILQP